MTISNLYARNNTASTYLEEDFSVNPPQSAPALASFNESEEVFQDAVQDNPDKVEGSPSTNTSKGALGQARDYCGAVINNPNLQLFIIFLIVVNALMMGVATFDVIAKNDYRQGVFEKCDKAFLVIFTVESAMQLVYHGWRIILDAWLFFDLSIVVISWSMAHLQVIRAFRVFRAFRLVTRLNVLRNLIVALFAVAPSVSAIMALLFLVMYIYAVLCTVLFKNYYKRGLTDEDYFGRLDKSMFTLFQMMTL
jgi:Ion transport protein